MKISKTPCNKGQSQMVSHSLTVLFALFLIIAVSSTMNQIENDYSNFTGTMQISDICSIIKTNSENIYQPYSENITSNRTEEVGYIITELPQKLGKDFYHITMFNNTVLIESPRLSEECEIGLGAYFSGMASGGRIKLRWLYGNGTNSITIENI